MFDAINFPVRCLEHGITHNKDKFTVADPRA